MPKRVRLERPNPRRRRRLFGGGPDLRDPLPLDPRDPDIVRVKKKQREAA